MKLYDASAPHPHISRLFAVERGASLDIVPVDIMTLENRRPPYTTEVSPYGELPALITDSGQLITEATVICEYLDEVTPGPSLFGETPEERANTRMWARKVYLDICLPAVESWRGTEAAEDFYSGYRTLIPEASRAFRLKAEKGLNMLDTTLQSRDYIAGDTFTIADIVLCCVMTDMLPVIPWMNKPMRPNVADWLERISKRPAVQETLMGLPAGPIGK